MKQQFTYWFFFLFISSVHAGNTSQLQLADNSFNENFNSNVPVSGRVIAGLMLEKKGDGDFFINLPAIETDSVCFRVQSKDGTYRSINQYKVDSKSAKGVISPVYPTKYNDTLNSFSSEELAILAFEGKCSDKKLKNVLVSSRGNEEQKQIVIMVSSGRSDVFLSTHKKKGRKNTLKCNRIEQGKRTAYDTICKVGLDSLIAGVNEISVLRRKSGRMLPPVKFNVLYTKS